MMNVVMRPLGIEAAKFIYEILSEGGSLSQAVAAEVPLQSGVIHSFALESIPVMSLLNFASGGKVQSGTTYLTGKLKVGNREGWAAKVSTTERILESEIRSFLSANPNNLVLIENSLAQASDPWLKRRKSSVVFLRDNSVVHFIDSKNVANIEIALTESRSTLHTPVFFVKREPQPIFKEAETLNDSQVNKIAHQVQRISIKGVYDGESHITWDKFAHEVSGRA